MTATTSGCFYFWNLGAEACASWVQAWGSILALGITGFGILYQADQQRKLAASVAKSTENRIYSSRSGALSALATGANSLLIHLIEIVSERKAFVEKSLMGGFEIYMLELKSIERWLENTPIHDLPDNLIDELLIITGNLRQVRYQFGVAVRNSETIDEDQFSDFKTMLLDSRRGIATSAVVFEYRTSLAGLHRRMN